ncbi:glycosyltransferase [Leptolyngbya sp. BL0902]|uniref:glycosyltransferase n=1 Tax=Leptolyngbya sp. BL0902 TaxID=1115757 RepID=UPI0018E7B8D0|nr:glycosyltransferase [Leptolyngbya sp. BL0902]
MEVGVRIPFFSVITVVRNEKDSILKTLQSVKDQGTYSSPELIIEHVLVDGLSTDGTALAIEEFIASNTTCPQIIYNYVSEMDSGIYDAMDKGRSMASGRFIFFLNAGDKFSSNDVLNQTYESILQVENLDLIFYGSVNINSELTHWKRPAVRPDSRIHQIDNINRLPHHQSIFYPRSFYSNHKYDIHFIKYGDTDYTLRACQQFYAYYLDLEITSVTLGGFSTKKHTFKEAYKIYLDFQRLSSRHPSSFSILERLLKPISFILKFLLDMVGGARLKHWAMKNIYKIRQNRKS